LVPPRPGDAARLSQGAQRRLRWVTRCPGDGGAAATRWAPAFC